MSEIPLSYLLAGADLDREIYAINIKAHMVSAAQRKGIGYGLYYVTFVNNGAGGNGALYYDGIMRERYPVWVSYD